MSICSAFADFYFYTDSTMTLLLCYAILFLFFCLCFFLCYFFSVHCFIFLVSFKKIIIMCCGFSAVFDFSVVTGFFFFFFPLLDFFIFPAVDVL